MAVLQWRRFNFFDKELVKNVSSDQPFDLLKEVNVSVCTSSRGNLIVGDCHGNVHLIDRQFTMTSFRAYKLCVTHVHPMKQNDFLFTVGEDEKGINPVIKVWNLDRMDNGVPSCTRLTRAIPDNKPTSVSCLAVHESLVLMAVGYNNGYVQVFKGDVTRDRQSKPHIMHNDSQPITGLAFRGSGKESILFVVTKGRILSIRLVGKESKMVLEQFGATLCNVVMSDSSQDCQLVIGRQDAVYFYQSDGRGPCLAFQGEKLQLHWFRGYLIVVSKAPPKAAHLVAVGDGPQVNLVTVYDIGNKFIAYTAPFPEVLGVMAVAGVICILSSDCKLYQLLEKDTASKLSILFKKNDYLLAVSLAKRQNLDEDGLASIFTQYGDHLYGKGDHDGAIQQYIQTIGKLEASYVIRKYLNAQKIHNLTKYLQALHTAHLATEEHTTLLLNCYIKLKDISKLDEFIMTEDSDVDFDVETAVRVCRKAGYHGHALSLAEKHRMSEWYLKIQLEDVHDHQAALAYISRLPFAKAEETMRQYGKLLMSRLPLETTEFLKHLCTDYRPSDELLVDDMSLAGCSPSILRANAEDFIHVFVAQPIRLITFLTHMVEVQPSSSSLVYNTLLELLLHDLSREQDISERVNKERKVLELLRNPDAMYDVEQAMVLCHGNSFKAGILFLYEKACLYPQILHYHMDHSEYAHVMGTCRKFGHLDADLWSTALSYFAQNEAKCKNYLTDVLSYIDKGNLLSPLMVVQTMANIPTSSLAVIKHYIIRRIQKEQEQISEDVLLIEQLEEDTAKKRSQIDQFRSSANVFQASKCNICNHTLELPSVHFLCEPHSYHRNCFESYADSDTECPICAPENRKLADDPRAHEVTQEFHDLFHDQLDKATDRFAVIAECFGRGLFDAPSG